MLFIPVLGRQRRGRSISVNLRPAFNIVSSRPAKAMYIVRPCLRNNQMNAKFNLNRHSIVLSGMPRSWGLGNFHSGIVTALLLGQSVNPD